MMKLGQLMNTSAAMDGGIVSQFQSGFNGEVSVPSDYSKTL